VHARRRPLLASILLLAAATLPGVSAQDEPTAQIAIFGAWGKTELSVGLLFHHPAYPGIARQAIALWEQAFPSLSLPLVPATVAPDILVTDFVQTAGGYACPLPDCGAGFALRQAGVAKAVCEAAGDACPAFLRGRIDGPVVVLVPPYVGASVLTTNDERFNFVLHEFGHALGLGHTDVQGDAMEQNLKGARRCVSNLDVLALERAYGFLPGPFQEPPQSHAIPASLYMGDHRCSSGGAPPPAPSPERLACDLGAICCPSFTNPTACRAA